MYVNEKSPAASTVKEFKLSTFPSTIFDYDFLVACPLQFIQESQTLDFWP